MGRYFTSTVVPAALVQSQATPCGVILGANTRTFEAGSALLAPDPPKATTIRPFVIVTELA